MITRRALLRSLLALPIAAVVDVEQWIWIPGQTIVVPTHWRGSLSLDAINAITLAHLAPALSALYFRDAPLLAAIRSSAPMHWDASRPLIDPFWAL